MGDENVIRREFPAVLEPTGDGRTIDIRIVPYNTPARVSDGGQPYEEEWAPGVFDKQLNAASRVLVNVEHEKGFGGVVGRGAQFRDAEDGFDASVRVLSGPDGDKALELVNEGVLTGVSLEAVPLKSERTEAGVVRRVKARLINVALCRFPAFADAQVLAVREEPAPDPETEPVLEPAVAAHVDETLARIGYSPLVRNDIVERPWDDSTDRFEDDEYERSCLVDRGGDVRAKARCSLPVLEPNGDLNLVAMRDAAKRLNQSTLGIDLKAQAARKLLRYYRQAGEEPASSLTNLAAR